MNYLLIFSYQYQEYFLINNSELEHFQNPELLFEFNNNEQRIAEKILLSLMRERRDSRLDTSLSG